MKYPKRIINVLKRVRDGKVYTYFTYTQKRGGRWVHTGQKAHWHAALDAGLVTRPPDASLGRPGYSVLTPLGEQVLREAEGEE